MEFNYFEGRPHDVVQEHRRRINLQVHERFRIRDLHNSLEMSATEFQRLYRMPQDDVVHLCNIIEPHVRQRTSPQHTSLLRKVLVTLSFLGNGSYQRLLGRSIDTAMSQSAVSQAFQEVVMALNTEAILTEYIKFPLTAEERARVIERNEVLGMTRTLGYIDGTLLKLTNIPRDNERQAYYTRKGWTGLNVQLICDADLYIMNVDSRFPGSVNDHVIWEASAARDVVEQAYWEDRCWLLGDSGYYTAPWLHVPIPQAEEGTPEYYYTLLHCHCRNAIERCIGVLKGRWRCLCIDRAMHYKSAAFAGCLMNACCVLHNYCLRRGLIPLDHVIEDVGMDVPQHNPLHLEMVQLGEVELQFLVNYAHQRRLHRDIVNVM